MWAETITFKNLDGESVTQDFYFNLNRTELIELETSVEGGVISFINKAANESDNRKLLEFFQALVQKSYGIKAQDNIHFLKEDPVDHHKYADEFKQCDAYDVLFMKLAHDDKAAAGFFNGIIPAEAAKEVEDMRAKEELPGQKNYNGPELNSKIMNSVQTQG